MGRKFVFCEVEYFFVFFIFSLSIVQISLMLRSVSRIVDTFPTFHTYQNNQGHPMTYPCGHRGKVEVQLQPFLKLCALKRVGGQYYTPATFPRERDPLFTLQEVIRAQSPVWTLAEISSYQDSIHGPSSPQEVAVPSTLSQPPFYKLLYYIFLNELQRNLSPVSKPGPS